MDERRIDLARYRLERFYEVASEYLKSRIDV